MTSKREIWRAVPSLPEYEASSWGRIRRVRYYSPKARRYYGGQPFPGTWSPQSKRYVLLWKGRSIKVARMVCEAFKGPPPPGKPFCLHRDEDSRNNRPGNLSWGTHAENMRAPLYLDNLRKRNAETGFVASRWGRRDD